MKNIDENIELIIVGDGPYKSELIKLKKLNVKNINFVGSQFDNIDFYWRSADLFVLPGLGGLAYLKQCVTVYLFYVPSEML